MAAPRPRTTIASSTHSTISFTQLGLPAALAAALAEAGIKEPFPIQAATLPDSLAGRDVLGRGRTGSGKTYAFALPVLARLAAASRPRRPGRPRALILAPTRELVTQIHATMAPLAATLSLRTMTIFGGVGANPQIRGVRAGVDVLVACPGRLRDLISGGHVSLDAVEVTVLDEADHMADLGFLPTVRWLMEKTPTQSQRLLFSATLDAAVDVLVRRFLVDPVTHQVDPINTPVATMSHHLLHVRADDRLPVLVDLAAAGRTLVFTRTKNGAKRLAKQLNASGVPSVELHGNLAQNARDRNLAAFAAGTVRTLVATDIAARGIHVDEVTLVVHADPPTEHKAYLHRSGRTARAGADGTVITLMTDDQVADVNALTLRAGISATTTRLRPGDLLLQRLAAVHHANGTWNNEARKNGESTMDLSSPATPTHSLRDAATPAHASERVNPDRPVRGRQKAGGRGRASQPSRAPAASRAKIPAPAAGTSVGTGGAAAFSSSARVGRRGR